MKSWIIMLLFLSGCTVTGNIVKEDSFDHKVYFCPETDCLKEFAKLLYNSSTANCALYNIDSGIIRNAEKNNVSMQIVIDSNYKIDSSFVRSFNKSGLMHDKFCVFDNNTVFTGSFNPVKGSYKDNNNIIVIKSKLLSNNYNDEFYELWNHQKNAPTENSVAIIGNAVVENYFCPEDDCAEKIENILESANESIYFMAYSFTHKGIANSLILKKAEGLEVRGIMEKNSLKDSVYETLKKNNITVEPDNSRALMHDKVFIIDKKIVVTGSFNPTNSGNKRNDENILIIHDSEIAQKYLEEFQFINS